MVNKINKPKAKNTKPKGKKNIKPKGKKNIKPKAKNTKPKAKKNIKSKIAKIKKSIKIEWPKAHIPVYKVKLELKYLKTGDKSYETFYTTNVFKDGKVKGEGWYVGDYMAWSTGPRINALVISVKKTKKLAWVHTAR